MKYICFENIVRQPFEAYGLPLDMEKIFEKNIYFMYCIILLMSYNSKNNIENFVCCIYNNIRNLGKENILKSIFV